MAPAARDDRRHALLSRAHAPAQAELDLYGSGAEARAAARRLDPQSGYNVQELEVKSALTRFGMPGSDTWSLNPYMGCSHDCVYCYVPDVAHIERARYGSYVVVKRNLPTVLAHELKTKARKQVFLSSATDPYQPAEGVYRVTRRALELLSRADWPVRVLTRNPLVRRDIDLFHTFSDFRVGMSVPTLDDAARRVLEPGAPSIAGRLAALRDLADAGLRPFANLAPAYPFTGGVGPRDIAAAFRDAGVAEVIAGPWKYLEGVMPALRDRVRGTLYDDFNQVVLRRDYYDRMFRALEAACAREGVPLRRMREMSPGRPSGSAAAPPPAPGEADPPYAIG